MANGTKTAHFLEMRMINAAAGDVEALFDLGVAYWSGSDGIDVDRVQAHKWFNLAAVSGNERGQECRAEIASDMTAREIGEAQRQARAWLGATMQQAA